MQNSGDTYAKHLLPNRADEHLVSKVTFLLLHIVYTFFFKGTVLPQEKKPAKLLF